MAGIQWSMTKSYSGQERPLTHLPLDKMATTLADGNFKYIFLNEYDRIPIQFSLKFVPSSPIHNMPALVCVGSGLSLVWCQAITWANADPVHCCIYTALTYQLAFPKPLTRPFVLKYVKLLGFANQASLPHSRLPGESHMSEHPLFSPVVSQWLCNQMQSA